MELTDVHLAILIATGLLILYADHEVLLYILGKKPILSERKNKWLHRAVWAGLCGMVVTGALLAFDARDYYFSDPAFLLKMVMVFALICNGILIGSLSRTASRIPFRKLVYGIKNILFVRWF